MVGIELWNRNRGFTRFYYNDGYYPTIITKAILMKPITGDGSWAH